ncbi:MAG TPA: metallophosphoesterase [Ktedonobacteraceae bacterium]|nr:metallophosphoesterase [Ktedonobacteraceae bacterium]
MHIDKLRWLHLSDFHTGKDAYGQEQMFRYILKYIEQKVKSGYPPDLVFLTGDIADTGNPREYKAFMDTFFRSLQATLGAENEKRIFLIPGNHDVAQDKMKGANFYELYQNIPELFDGSKEGARRRKEHLYPRFQPYMNAAMHAALQKDPKKNLKWLDSAEGCYTSVFTLNPNHIIGVLGLNTAWLSCDKNDQHHMTPGKSLIEAGLVRLAEEKCDTYFVLGHHPIHWFRDDEIGAIRALFGQYQVIYLHGHLHKTSGRQDEGGGYSFLTVQSGAAFQARENDERRVNQILWCELDYAQKHVLVDPMQWSREQQDWVPNAGAFPPPNQAPGKSRWFLRLPRSAEELAQDQDFQMGEDSIPLPDGWSHIYKQFLKERTKHVDKQLILRYFDGSFPNWQMILSQHERTGKANIPERGIVEDLEQQVEKARQGSFPGVTVLLGGSGEGKTTALMQTVHRVVQSDRGWNVIWHDDEEQGWSQDIQQCLVQTGGMCLVVSDNADRIGRRVYEFVKAQHKKGQSKIHFLLCCRDTDWRAESLHTLSWEIYSTYQEIPLKKLSQPDAEKVIDAWGVYEQEGLRELGKLSQKNRVQKLLEKARDPSNQESSFLGAMLQLRFGAGLREHVSLLLSRLNERHLSNGDTLLAAFAYIAAMHIRNDIQLPRAVLARILGYSRIDMHRYVIMPLGEEASISTSSHYAYTRHHQIAKVAVQLLEERFGFNLAELYLKLVRGAIDEFLDARSLPNIRDWNAIASRFYEEGQKELALRLAEEMVRTDPTDLHFIADLSKLYRRDKKQEHALRMFRDNMQQIGENSTYDRLRSDRGYYCEWATAEGVAGNEYIDAWLSGLALADEVPNTRIDNERAMRSLASLADVFWKLFEKHHTERRFIEACAAAAQLGLSEELKRDERAERNLHKGYNRGKRAGVEDLAPERALQFLQTGVAVAYKRCGEDLASWIAPGDELHFTKLARFLRINY